MKNILMLAMMAFGMANPGKVPWKNDFSSALQAAKKSDRVILINFHADWCPKCHRLEGECDADAHLVTSAKGIIATKVDTDKEGKEVAAKFGVSSFPTLLFVDKAGIVLARDSYQGPVSTDREIMRFAAYGDLKEMLARLRVNPKDGEANARLAGSYAARGNLALAKKYINQTRKLKPNGPWLARALIQLADAYHQSNRPTDAEATYRQATQTAQDPFEQSYADICLAYAYQAEGKKRELKAVCQSLISLPGGVPDWVNEARSLLAGCQ